MSLVIHVEPCDIINYYTDNQCVLACESLTIAQNDEFGVEICMSDTNGRPTITVLADGYQRAEVTTNVEGLPDLVSSLYETYLSSKAVEALSTEDTEYSDLDSVEAYTEEDLNDMAIDDRETELDAAVDDFLSTVLQTYGNEYEIVDEIHDDIKEHFLEYIYRKHNVEIYRPMYLEDEDGEEFFEEYPYECLEFEDEANPIYM